MIVIGVKMFEKKVSIVRFYLLIYFLNNSVKNRIVVTHPVKKSNYDLKQHKRMIFVKITFFCTFYLLTSKTNVDVI